MNRVIRILPSLFLMSVVSAHAAPICLPGPPPSRGALASAVARAPAAAPLAMAVVHTEGTLPHQGIHDKSAAAQRDFGYMRDLALAWHFAHDQAALDKLAGYLDTWTRVYRLSFDPVDETNFDGLIDAYVLAQADLAAATREATGRFIHDIGEGYLKQMSDHAGKAARVWSNNWQSHRVKLASISAAALGDEALLKRAREAFLAQVDANIGADGEVIDFRERDALHYVTYDLEPLVRAAVAAKDRGQDWLELKGSHGQSLQTALDWLLPYAQGLKSHEEFARTTVKFDTARREAGVSGFAGLWDPKKSTGLYWSAGLLDERYLATAKALAPTPPRWVWAISACQ